jgi:hypothetical protein
MHSNIIIANSIVFDSSSELISCGGGGVSDKMRKFVDHLLILNKLEKPNLYSKNLNRETSQGNSRFLCNPRIGHRVQ